ncbi:MAG: caspase family protein [Bacteroidetes bacterium]|nr:caspase family protein [Bacteroidota bacterium]
MPDPTRVIGSFRNNPPENTTIVRTNHLLVIGIDAYKNGISPLFNAVEDAKRVRDTLVDQFQFEQKYVRSLFNQEATKDNILAVFDEFLESLTNRDNLLIYYSGHGELHKLTGKGYWIPVDARLNKRGSYLSNNDVVDFFKSCKAHHIFSIVDSCFSGALFQTRSLEASTQKIEKDPSRWLLTAGRNELVSDGVSGENSPFAEALLSKLKLLEDPVLWTSDLCNYIKRVVPFNANQTPRGEPLQNVGHLGGEFVFYKKGYVAENKEVDKEVVDVEPDTKRNIEKVIPVESHAPQTFDELKTQLKQLAAIDLKELFDKLNEIVDSNYRKFNDLILLQGRYTGLERKMNQGVINDNSANIELNKIRNSALSFINRLTETGIKEAFRPKPPSIQFVDSQGNKSIIDLVKLENSGLKMQAELLIKKLNKLEKALILEDDPTRELKYEMQIEETKAKLTNIKEQLG